MPLIQKDACGLWTRQGDQIIRPAGSSRFTEGASVGLEHLPGTPLRGMDKTGDPKVAEFSEIWISAGRVENHETDTQKKDAYCLALARFYNEYPSFNPRAQSQRLDKMRYPERPQGFPFTAEESSQTLLARGGARLDSILAERELQSEIGPLAASQPARRPGL